MKQIEPIAVEPSSAFTILPHDVSNHSARIWPKWIIFKIHVYIYFFPIQPKQNISFITSILNQMQYFLLMDKFGLEPTEQKYIVKYIASVDTLISNEKQ